MKNIIIFSILFLAFHVVSLSGCASDGGSFTVTLTDSAVSYSSGKFIAAVYTGTTPVTSISVSTAQNLQGGNSISLTGFQSGTEYKIFIWIDADGDSSYGDDMKGYIMEIESIAGDFGLSLDNLFLTFSNKQLNLNANVSLASETAMCSWVLAGSLTEANKDLLAGSTAQRTSVSTLIGFSSGTYNGSGDAFTITNTGSDFPVPSYIFNDLLYDLYCFADMNSNELRDPGSDYEFSQTNITGDANSVSVTFSLVP